MSLCCRPDRGDVGHDLFRLTRRRIRHRAFARMSVLEVEPQQDGRPTTERAERWRLSNWRLRSKLLAGLAVPLLLACALGAFRVVRFGPGGGIPGRAGRPVHRGAARSPQLIDALQGERAIAVTFVAAGRPCRPGRARRGHDVGGFGCARRHRGPGRAARIRPDRRHVRRPGADRRPRGAAARRPPARPTRPERVEATYTAVIDSVRALERGVLSPVEPSLVRPATDTLLLADAKEEVQREHAVLKRDPRRGPAAPALADAARQVDAQLSGTLAELSTSAQASDAGAVSRAPWRVPRSTAGNGSPSRRSSPSPSAGRCRRPRRTGTPSPGRPPTSSAGSRRPPARTWSAAGSALAGDARAAAIRDGLLVVALLALTMVLLAIVARSLLQTVADAACVRTRDRPPRPARADRADGGRRRHHAVDGRRADRRAHAGRDRRGRARVRRRPRRGRAAGRAGGAPAPPRQRHLREPLAAQPEPRQPPAAAHRLDRAQRAGPRPARRAVPARPSRGPHAPQQREPARAGRRVTAAQRPGRPGVPAGRGCRPRCRRSSSTGR